MQTFKPYNTVLQGHAFDVLKLLPDNYVDVIVTSPPYWGLRDYGPECISVWDGDATCQHEWQNETETKKSGGPSAATIDREGWRHVNTTSCFCSKCGAWKGQLGQEPHPQLYIKHLADIFQECRRILKPSGSLWLNIGDTYYGGGGGNQYSKNNTGIMARQFREDTERENQCGFSYSFRNKNRSNWLQPKQKMMIPARVAIALQEQGWILRNELIWHKINHMPESVRDRLTRSYESIYFFVKSKHYFYNSEEARKPLEQTTIKSYQRNFYSNSYAAINGLSANKKTLFAKKSLETMKGANLGDVWSLTCEPNREEHYAPYPKKLVRQILKISAPTQTCVKCGKPKTPIITRINNSGLNPSTAYTANTAGNHNGTGKSTLHTALNIQRNITGYNQCGCNAGFKHALILDPLCWFRHNTVDSVKNGVRLPRHRISA